jgi:hypothetical protein
VNVKAEESIAIILTLRPSSNTREAIVMALKTASCKARKAQVKETGPFTKSVI